MRTQPISPFVEATVAVFDTMLGIVPARRGLVEAGARECDVTGVIGLCGQWSGMMLLGMQSRVALNAAGVMLDEPFEEVDETVVDVLGELTNMIAGHAKANMGVYGTQLALPSVFLGSRESIRMPSTVHPEVIEFQCDWGGFEVVVALVESPVEVVRN